MGITISGQNKKHLFHPRGAFFMPFIGEVRLQF